LAIDVLKVGAVHVIKLSGELRLGDTVTLFRKRADELIAVGDTRIVVDLSGVPMIDSTGIGNLVYLLTTCRKRGGDVKLVNPSDLAGHSLKLTGLMSLFEVYESITRAAASFGP
jgi:anti-sigma B factor antagonist